MVEEVMLQGIFTSGDSLLLVTEPSPNVLQFHQAVEASLRDASVRRILLDCCLSRKGNFLRLADGHPGKGMD
jgi:hypothetical protein